MVEESKNLFSMSLKYIILYLFLVLVLICSSVFIINFIKSNTIDRVQTGIVIGKFDEVSDLPNSLDGDVVYTSDNSDSSLFILHIYLEDMDCYLSINYEEYRNLSKGDNIIVSCKFFKDTLVNVKYHGKG